MIIKFDKTFDWFDVLEGLAQGKTINERTFTALHQRASDWPTCACGQLCKKLSSEYDGIPKDNQLRLLGVKFSQYVSSKQWIKALECFNKIEQRSAELLGLKLVPRHPKQSKQKVSPGKPFAVQMINASDFAQQRA